MSATTLLTLVATLLTVNGQTARVDRGLVHGLRPGDRCLLYYELTLGPEARRIELGSGELIALGKSEATIEASPDTPLRPYVLAQFHIPQDRLAPGATVAAAKEHLGREEAARLARRILDELLPASADLLNEETTEPAPREPEPEPADMIKVAGGEYWIGSELAESDFHNQRPRFRTRLDPYWIDRAPVSATEVGTDVTYSAAERHCERVGKRLPTELEWEIAAQLPPVHTASPPFEWTSSWYLPYPGNRHPEDEYGERFRVVRGSTDGRQAHPHQRRFMDPRKRSPQVGFRCARSAD